MKQYLVVAVEKSTRRIHKIRVEDTWIHGTYVEECIDELISKFGDVYWASFHPTVPEEEAEAFLLSDIKQREAIGCLLECWGEEADPVIEACYDHAKPMSLDEFKTHCTCCGGNWCAMLLSGINDLYPEVYDAIPDDMGRHSFECILCVMLLLGVIFEEGVKL